MLKDLRSTFLILVAFCSCSGQYVRSTYTISPTSGDNLRRLHEVMHGKDVQLRKVNEQPTAVTDLGVTPDSTRYLIRMPWISGVRPYNSFTRHAIPTTDVLSVSVCSVKHTTSYTALGAVAGGVFSTLLAYKYISALGDAIREDDGDPSFKLRHFSAMFLPGAILGGVIGMYVGETEAEWDTYRFNHGEN